MLVFVTLESYLSSEGMTRLEVVVRVQKLRLTSGWMYCQGFIIVGWWFLSKNMTRFLWLRRPQVFCELRANEQRRINIPHMHTHTHTQNNINNNNNPNFSRQGKSGSEYKVHHSTTLWWRKADFYTIQSISAAPKLLLDMKIAKKKVSVAQTKCRQKVDNKAVMLNNRCSHRKRHLASSEAM